MKTLKSKTAVIAAALCLVSWCGAAAQTGGGSAIWGESPEVYDSLLARWYERNVVESYERFFEEFIDVEAHPAAPGDIPDSVYRERMRLLLSPINMGFNEVIKSYIVRYTTTNRGLMGRVLGLSQLYFPMIEEELSRLDLPLELRMLPIIESALNPVAVSRAGATGLWQFMHTTGRSYGLEITSFIDQRRDPAAATRAACRYLGDLYRMYNDWTLAIAAYNCGPGNVNKAIKRAGEGAQTFWDVYPYLPRETRGYLPAFVAATYAYTFHRQHGIEMVSPPVPLATDTVGVGKLMHFDQIASTLDLPIEMLRALNPQYKLDIVPAVEKTYTITLPQGDVARYIEHEQEIMGKDTIYLAQYLKQPAEGLAQQVAISSLTYRIKSGDTLGGIARQHGVTVAQLVQWNGLRSASSVIRPGQVLEIHK